MNSPNLVPVAGLIFRAVLGVVVLGMVYIVTKNTAPDSVILLQVLTIAVAFLTFLATRATPPADPKG